MRTGGKSVPRLMAVLVVSVVALGAALPASATKIPLDTWSGRAYGSAVELSIQLPAAIQGAFQTHDLSVPSFRDRVVSSTAEAQWRWGEAGETIGHGIGELLDSTGTIGAEVGDKAPRAEVKLGEPDASGNMAKNDEVPGVSVGAGEVSASAKKLGAKVINSAGNARIANFRITLGDLLAQLPAGRDEINGAIDSLLGVLYGGAANPTPLEGGVIGQLQVQLDAAKKALADNGADLEKVTGLVLRFPTITRENLIDRPLVSIESITSTSSVTDGAGDLAGYKVTKARSVVKVASLLGGLVRIETLISEASVAVNGKPHQAKVLPAVQKVIGLTVGSNLVEIGDFSKLTGIKINGKNVDLTKLGVPAEVVAAISGLYETLLTDVVGLAVSVPAVSQGVEETLVRQKAHQYVTALNLRVAPLSQPVMGVDLSAVSAVLPTMDLKFSTANAEAGSTPLDVLPKCVGVCNPVTGVPTNLAFVFGPALLGAAILLRRFALASNR
ncbi:MAG: hypothetical protein HY775_11860 [Acidobacteria bacterium]|nr:hypothetical protein [Acidobacteriota bacterium]